MLALLRMAKTRRSSNSGNMDPCVMDDDDGDDDTQSRSMSNGPPPRAADIEAHRHRCGCQTPVERKKGVWRREKRRRWSTASRWRMLIFIRASHQPLIDFQGGHFLQTLAAILTAGDVVANDCPRRRRGARYCWTRVIISMSLVIYKMTLFATCIAFTRLVIHCSNNFYGLHDSVLVGWIERAAR